MAFKTGKPNENVWNKITIHNVNMEPVSLRVMEHFSFTFNVSKVTRQNRRGYDHEFF